jgi:hypothetical protein
MIEKQYSMKTENAFQKGGTQYENAEILFGIRKRNPYARTRIGTMPHFDGL